MKVILRMMLWGFVALVVSIFVSMELGLRWHDNYEYYGQYPIVYIGPTLLAFLAPLILHLWRESKSGK